MSQSLHVEYENGIISHACARARWVGRARRGSTRKSEERKRRRRKRARLAEQATISLISCLSHDRSFCARAIIPEERGCSMIVGLQQAGVLVV